MASPLSRLYCLQNSGVASQVSRDVSGKAVVHKPGRQAGGGGGTADGAADRATQCPCPSSTAPTHLTLPSSLSSMFLIPLFMRTSPPRAAVRTAQDGRWVRRGEGAGSARAAWRAAAAPRHNTSQQVHSKAPTRDVLHNAHYLRHTIMRCSMLTNGWIILPSTHP